MQALAEASAGATAFLFISGPSAPSSCRSRSCLFATAKLVPASQSRKKCPSRRKDVKLSQQTQAAAAAVALAQAVLPGQALAAVEADVDNTSLILAAGFFSLLFFIGNFLLPSLILPKIAESNQEASGLDDSLYDDDEPDDELLSVSKEEGPKLPPSTADVIDDIPWSKAPFTKLLRLLIPPEIFDVSVREAEAAMREEGQAADEAGQAPVPGTDAAESSNRGKVESSINVSSSSGMTEEGRKPAQALSSNAGKGFGDGRTVSKRAAGSTRTKSK